MLPCQQHLAPHHLPRQICLDRAAAPLHPLPSHQQHACHLLHKGPPQHPWPPARTRAPKQPQQRLSWPPHCSNPPSRRACSTLAISAADRTTNSRRPLTCTPRSGDSRSSRRARGSCSQKAAAGGEPSARAPFQPPLPLCGLHRLCTCALLPHCCRICSTRTHLGEKIADLLLVDLQVADMDL